MTKISNQYSLTNILTADLANSRLGINNVSPTVALDVTGAGKFSGASLIVGSAVAATNVKLFLNGVASKAASIEFQQSGVTQWYLGNGAASEDNNFELYNSNGTMAMKIIKSTNAIAFTGAATFSSSVTVGGQLKINQPTNDIAGGFLCQSNGGANGGMFHNTTSLVIREGGVNTMYFAAGNVGIGTSSPDQLVSIRKTSAGAETIALALQNIGSTTNTAVSMIFCPHENTSTPEPLAKISAIRTATSGAPTDITFYNYNFGLFERIRIIATGELCVGTNTPSYNTTNRGNITINGSASSLLAFQVGGTAKAYIYSDGTNYSIVNNAVGNIYVSSNGGGVQLNSGATSWASSSDERLKNINSNIENALLKLASLRTVNFSWKSDETQKEVLGLIAQDVDKVFPQVVDRSKLPADINGERTDETEYLNVRYTELIPVLVKAIQELSAKVSLLENK